MVGIHPPRRASVPLIRLFSSPRAGEMVSSSDLFIVEYHSVMRSREVPSPWGCPRAAHAIGGIIIVAARRIRRGIRPRPGRRGYPWEWRLDVDEALPPGGFTYPKGVGP